jgi:radical SAM superfamily enzyme YgiQ (UPF0313 family)
MTPLRFALVYPPFDDKRDRSAYYVAPPLGLLSIAAYLEAAGHEPSIADFVFGLKAGWVGPGDDLYERCAELVLEREPDVVGFGTQCSTGPTSINLARRLKELRPDLVVVLGGHDVSFLGPSYLDAFPFVDFVLGGECELTTPLLAAAIGGERSLADVPGLTYRHRGTARSNGGEERVTNLDSLLPPSYHLVDDLERYFELSRRPTILVDSGRGCAFACEFCQTTLLNGRKIRYRSVPSLVAELEGYRARYGDFEAYFVHDLFTARRAFVEELSRALIESEVGVSWQCRCRIDQVDPELLRLMNEAGCRMLLYGIESGSEETLARVNKRLRRGVARETTERVRWTVDAGIFPSLSMVVGIPEESLPDLNATLELAAEFVKIGRVNAFIQLMSPLPGTALAQRLEDRLEYRGEDAPTAFSQGIEFWEGRRLPEDEALIRAWPRIFESFYTVTPDHGDLDLCIDVSLAFCKLLEVYCYTFVGLADFLDVTLLELFRRFADELAASATTRRGLTGLKDYEIWDGFRAFVSRALRGRIAPVRLREAMRFEELVHAITVVAPVPLHDPVERGAGESFRLHPAARLFRSEAGPPWLEEDGGGGEQAHLVFMGPDRLELVRVDQGLADALELLAELEEAGGEGRHYDALARVLEPLFPLGLLEPVAVEPRVEVGV